MKKFLVCLFVACLFFSEACGRDKEKEEASEQVPPEVSEESYSEPREELAEEAEDYDFAGSSVPSLSDISSVKILTLSENPRDGFRVEITYNKHEAARNASYLYEWKINGEEIMGESGEELKWREGFRKGDTVTVSVIPYSDLGQGVMSAEGSFKIPNSPPGITSEPKAAFEDGKFSYTVEAVDPDGDPLDFTIRNAPQGMTIEPATGHISWEYGAQDSGEYTVIIIVSDSEGAEAVQELTLKINPDESAPEETL